MSMITGLIGAFVGLVARARPDDPTSGLEADLVQARIEAAHWRKVAETMQIELEAAQREARGWRREVERLVHASHRCQHQADLNRALNQDWGLIGEPLTPEDYRRAGMNVVYDRMVAQANRAQPSPCLRSISDCNMHRAELQAQIQMQAAALEVRMREPLQSWMEDERAIWRPVT